MQPAYLRGEGSGGEVRGRNGRGAIGLAAAGDMGSEGEKGGEGTA